MRSRQLPPAAAARDEHQAEQRQHRRCHEVHAAVDPAAVATAPSMSRHRQQRTEARREPEQDQQAADDLEHRDHDHAVLGEGRPHGRSPPSTWPGR
jgi:hypothetical protein